MRRQSTNQRRMIYKNRNWREDFKREGDFTMTDIPMPIRTKSVIGKVFGKLTVIEYGGSNSRASAWLCQCECGTKKIILLSSLNSGRTKSCGCLRKVLTASKNRIHGASKSREYWIWMSIKGRCLNPKNKAFANYGGRGVRVCDRWLDSFQNFITDIGPRPSRSHSIDRIDNKGNYEPGNCRWATRSEQNRNTRSNILMSHGGSTRTMVEWSEIRQIPYGALCQRRALGWSDAESLEFTDRPKAELGGANQVHYTTKI